MRPVCLLAEFQSTLPCHLAQEGKGGKSVAVPQF